MRPADLQHLLMAVPFVPFRVVMHDGKAYEVRHSELVRVGRSSCEYHYVPPPQGLSQRYDVVSYLLIERLEVAVPIPASSNGG
jgi:hypothetical protein